MVHLLYSVTCPSECERSGRLFPLPFISISPNGVIPADVALWFFFKILMKCRRPRVPPSRPCTYASWGKSFLSFIILTNDTSVFIFVPCRFPEEICLNTRSKAMLFFLFSFIFLYPISILIPNLEFPCVSPGHFEPCVGSASLRVCPRLSHLYVSKVSSLLWEHLD